ncbi:hypothetical protein CDD81_4067 [Ophiocordyceps australis]|uniref:NAD dependent epimerase/dehydratase n=1 Tax=Ophiocordyceps australis TaxID=1399860 RepID=A0A2C5XU86_9HYPO|nr:hypothetical protein CDD81_4067 [Ophiocordyceps australis]
MGGVPSVPKDPSRSIQVIGAGYSRTGTVSMALALEKLLDGPVLHGGTSLFGREEAYVKLWCQILRNRHNRPVLLKLLRQATQGFVAITDAPGIFFLPELLELYPDAKVVLVTRDPGRWEKSIAHILRNIYWVRPWWFFCILVAPLPTWRLMPTWMAVMRLRADEIHGDCAIKDRIHKHNAHVRSIVPPHKLLTMQLSDGWAPLANFIDVPVPHEPFPRANDGPAIEALRRKILASACLAWMAILAAGLVLAWCVARVVYSRPGGLLA